MNIFDNSPEYFSSWQCILKVLDARSLALCARTCTTFRDYAKGVFEKKRNIAYGTTLSFLIFEFCDRCKQPPDNDLYNNSEDWQIRARIVGRYFGEWCPERSAELMIAYLEERGLKSADTETKESEILYMNSIIGDIIFIAIFESRGMSELLRYTRDSICEMCKTLDYKSDEQCREMTNNFAKYATDRITAQNEHLVLPWIEHLPGYSLDLFNFAANTARKNEALLERVMDTIVKSTLDLRNYVFPHIHESSQRRMARIISQSVEAIKKYGQFVSPDCLQDAARIIIAVNGDTDKLMALEECCHFRDDSVIYYALAAGRFSLAAWMLMHIRILYNFHNWSMDHIVNRYYSLVNATKEGWHWILQTVYWNTLENNHITLQNAKFLLCNYRSIGYMDEIILFIEKHDLFANAKFLKTVSKEIGNIRNISPNAAELLECTIREKNAPVH
ncbi:MAG: hypothetical protein M0R33_18925 [Methylomonas sp.]|jgi:hypothetical protein|uniref:hypothetical protein n=1 Tax=Methylomonas sp. TaxID=418 RepID=UPI0025CC4F9A|nr:hypothetical protein [Methylomonas sp.]MCK9608519.1 hypothetical protein [Methylomonas sp.]